ncbi:hypothetical protein [Alkalihalophilus marmarensis]|uniref:hypothetical protein n=1 Tax=Alkalihalophilus marmarensis TaxID=521377 RepID=UPI002DBDD3CA|nr:hypothetical protein [Alkalihalophilus marmarensis]MEC2072563.1 hypothetical protein [Alkalihalophilus marmarensis]
MKVHILHDRKKEQDWVTVIGDYEHFRIWGDQEDYVEAAIYLMQKVAVKCFQYPFYIYFEGYEDEVDSVLERRDEFDIYYQPSRRTILTMCGGKTYDAEIPSLRVTIPNNETLEKIFTQWFYLAQQNNMWLITQHTNVYNKNTFAAIDFINDSILLLADHDAQGFSVITNHPSCQQKEQFRSMIQD